MIKSFTITNFQNDSIVLSLTEPEKSGFAIRSVDGLGPANASINVSDAATRDGSIYNSARTQSRNIVFDLIFVESESGESIEEVRHKSYRYFASKKKLTIGVETDTRNLLIDGYVETNEPDIFSNVEGASISIICPNPYFRDRDNQSMLFSGVESEFVFHSNVSSEETYGTELVFPTSLVGGVRKSDGVSFSLMTSKQHESVIYSGDVDTGVTMTIDFLASVEDIRIENETTGEWMGINTDKIAAATDSSGITAGDRIVITTTKGEKRINLIRDTISYNILSCLETGSSWITMYRGVNTFSCSASYEDGDGSYLMQFLISNNILYEGA